MELLYGTTNPGKLDAMSRALAPLGLTLVGLRGLGLPIPAVEEEGNTILENAEQKARAYYKAFGRPVFSCDSGLYFDELPEAEQPGLHVRRVNGRSLTDAEAQEYYGAMARRHGGEDGHRPAGGLGSARHIRRRQRPGRDLRTHRDGGEGRRGLHEDRPPALD